MQICNFSSLSFLEIEQLSFEINSFFNQYYSIEKKSDLDDSFKKLAFIFWSKLIPKPLKELLFNSVGGDLILSLDEELVFIPWEILFDGQQFLCLKFNIGRIVKTKNDKTVFKQRIFREKFKFLILSNPTQDLEKAYIEGKNIKDQVIENEKNIDVDFKSSNINMLFVTKNICDYDIVHYAGHCKYNFLDINDTGWVLQDGIFSYKDIQALAEDSFLPSLVFSNGCESAKNSDNLKKNDYQKSVYSIAYSFIFSGVNHYIGSIVKVDEQFAYIFAQKFYYFLLRGFSVGSCIRLARLEIVKKYGFKNMNWASYVLYGDPSYKYLLLNGNKNSFKKIIKKFILPLLLSLFIICCFLIFNPKNFLLEWQIEKMLKKGDNQKVINLISSRNTSKFQIKFYPLIALAYERIGKNEEAIKYYFDYALFNEKRKNFFEVSSSYLQIGWIYHKLGEFQKALEFYTKAFEISFKNKDNLNLAVSLRKQAVWYMDKQDDNKALELLTRSAEINREHPYSLAHRNNLACDYFDLGLLFTNKNDFVTAKDFYRKSLDLFKSLKNDNELSDCYFNLGEIYLFEKSYRWALECYLKGIEIDLKYGNVPNIASGYNMLAELYFEMEDLEKAYDYLKKAQKLHSGFNSPLDLANIYYNLGIYHKKKNEREKSRYYFELGLNIYKVLESLDILKVQKELDLLKL